MKRLFFLALLMAGVVSATAQTKVGGIDEDMLARISKVYTATPAQKAVKNALSSTSMATLATNSENLAMIDTHFSHCVYTQGVTDQKSSGRCWLFTGLNVLRAKMIAKHNLAGFEFSQNYNFFYDQLEKSNLFLQAIIDTRDLPLSDRKVDWLLRNPLSDGGQFTGVSNLIMKYGVVPKSAMPETYQSNNTSAMGNILKLKLREWALELRELKPAKAMQRKGEMLSEVYYILVEWARYDKSG